MPGVPTDWMVDFSSNSSPRFTQPVGKFTVFKVPEHLRGGSPDSDNSKIRMLQLGLQNRTIILDAPKKVYHNLKLELANVLHLRLRNNPPSTPVLSGSTAPHIPASTLRSWNDFAEKAVGNVDTARNLFEKPTDDQDNPRMPDDAVQNHLALDAVFIVFYFHFFDGKKFNIKEFETVAKDRDTIIRSLGLSDFLLLENQVPMSLLKNVVIELCKIADDRMDIVESFKNWHPVPFDAFVEYELNRVLASAVSILLPTSLPTLVHPNPNPRPSMIIFDKVGHWMKKNCLWQKEAEVSPDKLFKDHYLDTYYPPHPEGAPPTDHGLRTYDHILDCVYRVVCGHVVGTSVGNVEGYSFLESIPSAARLEEVGIKVEPSTQCTANSVELTHGYRTWIWSAMLKLPKVEILNNTAQSFRNLVIYEQLLGQHRRENNSDLRCYLEYMSDLCRDAADLQLLCKRGVLSVRVSDEDALATWGKILDGVDRPVPSEAWKKFYSNVYKHRHSVWKPWRRKHCGMFWSQPWKKLSILAAIILLVFTALQTWFTVVNSDRSGAKWPKRN
ncbi:hypothetical protein M758_11G012000 [Ceratodon purpureus]|nr:hypothetical protein M758_11G012000 [Ceratodon purpureus]